MARRGQDEHDYRECTDDGCPRFPCRLWKEAYDAGRRRGFDEGYSEGYAKGWADGYAAGHGEGYAAGYAAGAASCR